MARATIWTPALVERLRELALAGRSTRAIAEEFSDPVAGVIFTRSMIIGKAWREDIMLEVKSAPHITPRVKRAPPSPPCPVSPSVPKVVAAPVRDPVARVEKGMTGDERMTYRQREHARVLDFIERTRKAKREGGVPFMERRIDECAYLLGTGYQSMVCGKPVEKRAYCTEHAALCYTTTPRMMGAMKPPSDSNVVRLKVKPEVEDDEIVDVEPVDAMLSEDVEIDEEAFSAL